MGYDTCVPVDTEHHQAIWSLLGGFGWRERKKWLIHSPHTLWHVWYVRDT